MTTRRKILFGLLIIPTGFFIYSLLWPFQIGDDSNLVEIAAIVLSVPIVVFNVWDWQEPDFLDIFFKKGE